MIEQRRQTNLEAEPAEAGESSRKIDIGGRRLALTCSGRGSVTVLLETGLGAESAEWASVQAELSAMARVVRYDRANRGASDPAPKPRSAVQMVEDLESLLAKAGIEGPYVCVGHSFGGLLARLFAARNHAQVKGLVLVDSLHAEQFNIFGRDFPPPTPGEPPALAGLRAFWTVGWRSPDSTTEGIDMPASLEQDRAIGALHLPVRIIHADTFLHQDAAPPQLRPILHQRWTEMQRRFLALSARAELVHASGSGHFVQRDAPALVANTIKALLAQADAPRPKVRP